MPNIVRNAALSKHTEYCAGALPFFKDQCEKRFAATIVLPFGNETNVAMRNAINLHHPQVITRNLCGLK
jgi:hypothetical protein